MTSRAASASHPRTGGSAGTAGRASTAWPGIVERMHPSLGRTRLLVTVRWPGLGGTKDPSARRARQAAWRPEKEDAMKEPVELTVSECLGLLGGGVVGRVALSTRLGPRIVPVNYAMYDGAIIFRTSPYSE